MERQALNLLRQYIPAYFFQFQQRKKQKLGYLEPLSHVISLRDPAPCSTVTRDLIETSAVWAMLPVVTR